MRHKNKFLSSGAKLGISKGLCMLKDDPFLSLFTPRAATAAPKPVTVASAPAAVPEDHTPLVDAARAKVLTKSLERMSLEELRKTAKTYDTSGALLASPMIARSRDLLRQSLIYFFACVEEESTDSPEVVDAWLASSASIWPAGERPPPKDMDEALDPDGLWGMAACGVEVKQCVDHESKGKGAFAVRQIQAGAVVAVYAGEHLTQREHSVRHDASRSAAAGGPRPLPILRPLTGGEKAALEERRHRLEELTPETGAPAGGAANGGAYTFGLLPDSTSAIFPGRVAFIDAEDPRRSNWARYVNHAPEESQLCNTEPHIDATQKLVWLQATRDIAPGEEICFDYGDEYNFEHEMVVASSEARKGS